MKNLTIKTPKWTKPLFIGENGKPRYRGAKGGRASGKSHFFAEAIIERLVMNNSTRVVCVREVQRSLKFSSKQLLEDKINSLEVNNLFEITATEIKMRYGKGVIIFQGMQDHTSESVKSLEGFDLAWIEEAQSLSTKSLELLDPTLRKEGSEIWCSWNPNKSDDPVEKLFIDNANAILVHVNYIDNPFVTLAVKEMAERTKNQNTLKYNHIWLGDYMKEIEGALWTSDLIEKNIIEKDQVPDLQRLIIAIDPAVTGNKTSDETGIIVVGRCHRNNYYVLEDCSLRAHPDQWIKRAINKYHQYDADRIIAEVNNGGDLVENLLRNTDRNVSFKSVRATRGKILRAEPIAALYESDKVFHVGKFAELEEQMIFYNGQSNISPDRLDALVWGITELSQYSGEPVWRIS